MLNQLSSKVNLVILHCQTDKFEKLMLQQNFRIFFTGTKGPSAESRYGEEINGAGSSSEGTFFHSLRISIAWHCLKLKPFKCGTVLHENVMQQSNED